MKKPLVVVIEPRIRITCGRRFAFGPGQAQLLENIAQAGSIAAAAKAMRMSYMRAWMLVKRMNHGFTEPLVATIRGGGQRGGAQLTATGGKVLRLYREIELQGRRAARSSQQNLAALLRH